MPENDQANEEIDEQCTLDQRKLTELLAQWLLYLI